MPTGLKDLFASERGVLAILAIIAVTVLCALGRISPEVWVAFTGGVTGLTTISKTFTGVAEIKNAKPSVTVVPPANGPAVVVNTGDAGGQP